jgi:hypothetical protein
MWCLAGGSMMAPALTLPYVGFFGAVELMKVCCDVTRPFTAWQRPTASFERKVASYRKRTIL